MNNKIKVVLCEPRKEASVVEIGASLDAMQKTVDGYIEEYRFTDQDNVLIICNDEAKYFDEPLNRSVNGFNIAGTFFVCGYNKDDYISLTDEQAEKYKEQFFHPHAFFLTSDGFIALPVAEVKEK